MPRGRPTCNRTRFSPISTTFSSKSMPMVCMYAEVKDSVTNLFVMEVFPTPASPISKSTRIQRGWVPFSWEPALFMLWLQGGAPIFSRFQRILDFNATSDFIDTNSSWWSVRGKRDMKRSMQELATMHARSAVLVHIKNYTYGRYKEAIPVINTDMP